MLKDAADTIYIVFLAYDKALGNSEYDHLPVQSASKKL